MPLNKGVNILSKKRRVRYALNTSAFICFLLALVLAVLLRIFALDEFNEWYGKYTEALVDFENRIQTYGATWQTVVIILLNFALKSVLPWFPISCICVACSVIFKWYQALIVNAAGLAILYSIRYFWGKRFGGGNAEKLIEKNDALHRFIDSHKIGSPVVLFMLRLIPVISVNNTSMLYGTTDIGYIKYILVSLAGFSYKLFSYTLIGRNVFDPASASFIVPLLMLCFLTGVVLLILAQGIGLTKDKTKNQ